jgi:predicted DNA-binding transcriptional regulator YafY
MNSNEKNKLRIVKIIEYLMTESDEKHPVTVANIIEFLEDQDITADRKTIYSDIKVIDEYFLAVKTIKSSQNKYYLEDRQFKLSEIQLIVSAIVSAGFIDEKTSNNLIAKLFAQTSVHIAKEIKGNITIKNPKKHKTSALLDSIETIISAIRQRKQISYEYIKHNNMGQEIVNVHKFTPVDLIYNDDYYYCICVGVKEDMEKFYSIRIDRMRNVCVSESDAISHKYNSEAYVKTQFQMWATGSVWVELYVDNKILDSMYDKFGPKLIVQKVDEDTAKINVEVSISPAFYAWIFTFGDQIKIITPNVLEGFINYIKTIISVYNSPNTKDFNNEE